MLFSFSRSVLLIVVVCFCALLALRGARRRQRVAERVLVLKFRFDFAGYVGRVALLSLATNVVASDSLPTALLPVCSLTRTLRWLASRRSRGKPTASAETVSGRVEMQPAAAR